MQPPPSPDPQPRTEDGPTSAACVDRRVVGGQFELGELLGMGAASSVYACKGLDAAIKIFDSVEEDARRRFLDEGRLLSRLRHPHLVHVIAVAVFFPGVMSRSSNGGQTSIQIGPWRSTHAGQYPNVACVRLTRTAMGCKLRPAPGSVAFSGETLVQGA